MLGAYEDPPTTEGWVVISETATPHLIDRITHEHLPRLLRVADPRRADSHLTGMPGGFGATITSPTGAPRARACDPSRPSWPTYSGSAVPGC